MSPPSSSIDAATGPEPVQVAAPAPAPMDSADDPCRTHSKDFLDCLNSHEIKLGKCMHNLGLLHQCRWRADDAMEHSKVQEGASAPAGSCYIPYQALKNCLINKEDINNDEVKLGKCELFTRCLCATRELVSFSVDSLALIGLMVSLSLVIRVVKL